MTELERAREETRTALGDILHVGAELARQGDNVNATILKSAYDNIRQNLCNHDKGTTEALYMSGRKLLCKLCGKDMT